MANINGGWADWLREGYFISYLDRNGDETYWRVRQRDFAHYEYEWDDTIATGVQSGPITLEDIVPTRSGRLWQIIFGVKPDCYFYINVPSGTTRHGIPKRTQGTAGFRTVAHYTEEMTPWDQPSWITEFFLMPKFVDYCSFTVFNNTNITQTPKINLYINKLDLEAIGFVQPNGTPQPAEPRFGEILNRLHNRLTACRPVTIEPVVAPAKVQ